MITNLTRKIQRCSTVAILAAVVSCDSFREDFIQPDRQVMFADTEYYILPGATIVIDLKSIIKQSFATASLTISRRPTRGELSQLDTLLLKYEPQREFVDGNDQFIFTVTSNGTVLKSETVTIQMRKTQNDLPCTLYAVQDKASVKSHTSVSIRFLQNDHHCYIDQSSIVASIYSGPRFGEAKMIGDSVVTYTPGPQFTGEDEIIYKITTPTQHNPSYGIITIGNTDIQILEIPGSIPDRYYYIRKFLFVNDSTGFLLADSLYKTTDGGEHWRSLSYPFELLVDIQFLDANIGFAAPNQGPLMHTTDGGESWSLLEKYNYQHTANSIQFISPTTGFISTYRITVFWDSIQHHLFKTKDGGATYKQVLTSPDDIDGILNLQFVNSSIGYAYQRNKIFMTADGGESWKLWFTHPYILSLKVTPEQKFFGAFLSDTGYDFSKSTDGLTWQPIPNLLDYSSDFNLAFSPSHDLGIVAGVRSYDPSIDIASQFLTISKSVDKGDTWTGLNNLIGWPMATAVPSGNVAYILCTDKLIKYTRP